MTAERIARPLALVIAAFGVVILVGAGLTPHVKPDADAYWLAAVRLRDGEPLYLPVNAYADEIDIYRYAPWFAYAWIPLTYLPQEVAYALWRLLLAAGAVAAVVPILRRPSPAAVTLGLLTLGLLLSNLPAANVTALLVGLLALSLPTRFGPLALGIAGSLKVFPLILVAGYLAERRWRAAVIALLTAALLWSPILLFGVSSYPTALGGVSLLRDVPWLWALLTLAVAGSVVVTVARRSRWAWLAAAAAIPTVVPRIWIPDAAYVSAAVGLLDPKGRNGDTAPASRSDTPGTTPSPPPDRA